MTTAEDYRRTRESLHAVAEQLLAGPQYRRSGTIRLDVTEFGFETVKQPRLAVHEALFYLGDSPMGELHGETIADLAAAVHVEPGMPDGVYSDRTEFDSHAKLWIDPKQYQIVTRAFELGDNALRALAPGRIPVLWPEHFDLGIDVDEVNYGVSPGDGLIPEPYAYVGPWKPRSGEFWNQSFGATRTIAELGGSDALLGFFAEGRRLAAQGAQ